MFASQLAEYIKSGNFDTTLNSLYGDRATSHQRSRYINALSEFARLYGDDRDVRLFSVPGRSEISGNHTDHNCGRVIAAAVSLDIIAVAAKNGGDTIHVKSRGFSPDRVSLAEPLSPKKLNHFKSASLIAGVCAGLEKDGLKYGAFDAYTDSEVLRGSGLSSSAAFEVMIGNIQNHLYNNSSADNPHLARIAQYAENEFFGKPCGLMDQTACAVGGFVTIDFAVPDAPVIEKIDFDISRRGYTLCIVDTGGNHADLNEDYASVPAEMKAVAAYFGRPVLRGLTYDDIVSHMPALRRKCGDRAILRALHFINENERVTSQCAALRSGDLDSFFDGVIASGESSRSLLQNTFTTKNMREQGLTLALELSRKILSSCDRKSAWRVHGGGFAGTIQAFVPDGCVAEYRQKIDAVFGENSCRPLRIRPMGASEITPLT